MTSQPILDYEQYYNDAPCGFFTTDLSGRIVKANNTFLRWVGKSRHETINIIRFSDLLSIGGKLYYETHYHPLLRMQGSVKEIRLDLINTDKSRLPVLINSTLHEDADGEPGQIRSTVFDITQRKKYESELLLAKRKSEDLLDELRSKNVQLLQQKEIITKQNKDLEALIKVKDTFFGIVAHDLKSPLHSLKSFTILIQNHLEGISKAELQEMTMQLQHSLDSTLELAENLFTWARVQMKELEVQPTKICLKKVIDDVFLLYQLAAEKKDIAIHNYLDESLEVYCDPNQLGYILRNLINNAVKFTYKNGEINVFQGHIDDKQVEIYIADSGMGISQKVLDIIIEEGKVNSTFGTEGEKGTGLGLMLTVEFVKKNGGSLKIINEHTPGTTFSLTLPTGNS